MPEPTGHFVAPVLLTTLLCGLFGCSQIGYHVSAGHPQKDVVVCSIQLDHSLNDDGHYVDVAQRELTRILEERAAEIRRSDHDIPLYEVRFEFRGWSHSVRDFQRVATVQYLLDDNRIPAEPHRVLLYAQESRFE